MVYCRTVCYQVGLVSIVDLADRELAEIVDFVGITEDIGVILIVRSLITYNSY